MDFWREIGVFLTPITTFESTQDDRERLPRRSPPWGELLAMTWVALRPGSLRLCSGQAGGRVYEIVAGFIANCIIISLINIIVKQKDAKVLNGFEEVIGIVKKAK